MVGNGLNGMSVLRRLVMPVAAAGTASIAGSTVKCEEVSAVRPVVFTDRWLRCKAENPNSSLVRCFYNKDADYAESRDIWDALAKCSNQSQEACNAGVGQFKHQLLDKKNVWSYQGLYCVDHYASGRKMTPAHLAVTTGSVKAVVALLANGANPSSQDKKDPKFSLVHELVERSKRGFKESGAKGNILAQDFTSTDADNSEIVLPKVEFNGQIHHRPYGPSYASKQADYLQIAKILIAAGADLTVKDVGPETALEFCKSDTWGKSDPKLCELLQCATDRAAMPWYKKLVSK